MGKKAPESSPAYEEFDLEIKNEQELEEAKKEAGVKKDQQNVDIDGVEKENNKAEIYLNKAKEIWLEHAEIDLSLGHFYSAIEKCYKAGETEKAKEILLKSAKYHEQKKSIVQPLIHIKDLEKQRKRKKCC